MKILVVNELLLFGGAEQFCLNLIDILKEKNNEVHYLVFDDNFDENLKKIKNVNNLHNIKIKNKILNKLLFNPLLYLRIRKILKKVKPDKVIINKIFSSPKTQLSAFKGYDTYKIIHDYGIVCPRGNSVKDDFSICSGYKFNKCVKNCKYFGSKITLFLKLQLTKKMEKLRKKNIKYLISPSENLAKYLNKYGYNACCINNPMDLSKFSYDTNKRLNKNKKYVYFGMINENKGIYKFLDAYIEFSKNKNIELDIIGKCTSKDDEERFKKYLENDKINFLGYMKNTELLNYIKKSDFSIIPSLWIENYPTTAMEAILNGCVVLGSNRGGIPEIIGDGRGLIYDILDKESIIKVLNDSYNMTEENYSKMRKKAYDYIIKNNSYDKYYEQIIKVLTEK